MTEKQTNVFRWFVNHPNKPIRPHDLAKLMGYTESAYIYGGLSYLYKNNYIVKLKINNKVNYKFNEKIKSDSRL